MKDTKPTLEQWAKFLEHHIPNTVVPELTKKPVQQLTEKEDG